MKFALIILATVYSPGDVTVEKTPVAIYETSATCERALVKVNRAVGRNSYGANGGSSKTRAVCIPTDAE